MWLVCGCFLQAIAISDVYCALVKQEAGSVEKCSCIQLI